MPIQELFDIRNGYTPSTLHKEYWENGTIPWFRMEDIREKGRILNDSIQHISKRGVKGNLFKKNSIIFATSATIGEHALIKDDFLCNQRFTCLSIKQQYNEVLLPKYIYYYGFLIDEWCINNTMKSNFASVDMNGFKKFKISFPSLKEQERIVSLLDKFDAYCNDLTQGIPAEIEARKKQYEYYRDKLLTFKRLEK
ncbi:MAG: restriction endonuclease subunit S [Bacilli bacterium]|nr:restriction endonuclease subunit S [Bacilli bacterium]